MVEKIVVGMSGGVDSSVSLILLKEQGWDPVGVSLKLDHWHDKSNTLNENVCCTTESFNIAKEVCAKMNVPYHVYDVSKDFRREVMDYFLNELRANRTPNPCIKCNRHLKFAKLFEWADKHGIKHVATGHYAVTRKMSNRFELVRGKDGDKEQTYGLCMLPQEWIKRIVFPLGRLTKDEVFDIAVKNGFDIFLKRKQSQDLCFVSRKALDGMVKKKLGVKKGHILDGEGRIVGEHKGLHFYTIGQRVATNMPDKYFVRGFNSEKNIMIVTKNRKDVGQKEVYLKPYNIISGNELRKMGVMAKVRYRQVLSKAVVIGENGKIKVVFDKKQDAVTPGQYCVFYKGDVCIGGGVIN